MLMRAEGEAAGGLRPAGGRDQPPLAAPPAGPWPPCHLGGLVRDQPPESNDPPATAVGGGARPPLVRPGLRAILPQLHPAAAEGRRALPRRAGVPARQP